MPCYLFTFHSYGSWLPDRSRGFVRRHQGMLPQDHDLATTYRRHMPQIAVHFDSAAQRAIIETLLDAASYLDCRVHAAATDNQHIHLIVSWRDERRGWEKTRASFKKSITIKLKSTYGKQRWLSRDASRKQVKDRSHFEYLVGEYLPNHRGWKWDERVGHYRCVGELNQRLSDEA